MKQLLQQVADGVGGQEFHPISDTTESVSHPLLQPAVKAPQNAHLITSEKNSKFSLLFRHDIVSNVSEEAVTLINPSVNRSSESVKEKYISNVGNSTAVGNDFSGGEFTSLEASLDNLESEFALLKSGISGTVSVQVEAVTSSISENRDQTSTVKDIPSSMDDGLFPVASNKNLSELNPSDIRIHGNSSVLLNKLLKFDASIFREGRKNITSTNTVNVNPYVNNTTPAQSSLDDIMLFEDDKSLLVSYAEIANSHLDGGKILRRQDLSFVTTLEYRDIAPEVTFSSFDDITEKYEENNFPLTENAELFTESPTRESDTYETENSELSEYVTRFGIPAREITDHPKINTDESEIFSVLGTEKAEVFSTQATDFPLFTFETTVESSNDLQTESATEVPLSSLMKELMETEDLTAIALPVTVTISQSDIISEGTMHNLSEHPQTTLIYEEALTDKGDSLIDPSEGISFSVVTNTVLEKSSNSISVKENVLLEASPNMEVFLAVTSSPLDPSSFDAKIKTIKDLKVDPHVSMVDPSLIAKATSYEESSFSTATRSATVTTWVDPNTRNVISQRHSNFTKPDNRTVDKIADSVNVSELPRVSSNTNGFVVTTNKSISYNENNAHVVRTNNGSSTYNEESNIIGQDKNHSIYNTLPQDMNSDVNANDKSRNPLLKLDRGDFADVSGIHSFLEENGTGENLLYEVPEYTSSGLHLSPSIIISLSVCCSIVILISIFTVFLWLFRRHRNRSKIYLSQDTVKPRAFFTKPMNPALLPNERLVDSETLDVVDIQKPKTPVVLLDNPDFVCTDTEVIVKSHTDKSVEGREDCSFVNIPLDELKPKVSNVSSKPYIHYPPKFGAKSLKESDSDSGIKVWSSTGSLYAVSEEHCHCSVPPPPYSSSVSDEFVSLSVDNLQSSGSKSRLLYV
ncbi:hypothetical protein SK128_011342 [Halocaridina rubra]|uniref:Uncharacterized protein n=1 Tax=Halocaridina rubra TaxID=373956 RepID=A0AAN8ZYB2_HALRR